MESHQTIDLIPDKLRVHIHSHTISLHGEPSPCVTLMTDGLWAQRQKEMVCTLLIQSLQQPDLIILLQFFQQVYQFATQRQYVDDGGRSGFNVPNFFGRNDVRGFVYVRSEPLDGIVLPAVPSLALIIVFGDEMEAFNRFGVTRLLAKLGETYHAYPSPFWSDPYRPAVFSLQQLEQTSILAKTPTMYVQGASFIFHDKHIHLNLKPSAQSFLQPLAEFPLERPIAIFTDIDDSANACLVWQAHTRQPTAITPAQSDASRLTGNFIVFVPQQNHDGAQMVEDGFGVYLTDASWLTLKQALVSGSAFTLKGQEPYYDLEVTWLKEAYVNPIDKTALHVDGGWKTYLPDSQTPRAPVDTYPLTQTHIVLLSTDDELQKYVGAQRLSDYIIQVQNAVRDEFKSQESHAGFDLLLHFEVSVSTVTLTLGSRPGIGQEDTHAVRERLLTITAPAVQGTIKFQVLCALFGGSGQPLAQFS